jgi:hypothetical protein
LPQFARKPVPKGHHSPQTSWSPTAAPIAAIMRRRDAGPGPLPARPAGCDGSATGGAVTHRPASGTCWRRSSSCTTRAEPSAVPPVITCSHRRSHTAHARSRRERSRSSSRSTGAGGS